MVNIIKFFRGNAVCGCFLISKINSRIGIIDIMVSRDDQYRNTCILNFVKLLSQFLMIDLLPVHGNITTEYQCCWFFSDHLIHKSI